MPVLQRKDELTIEAGCGAKRGNGHDEGQKKIADKHAPLYQAGGVDPLHWRALDAVEVCRMSLKLQALFIDTRMKDASLVAVLAEHVLDEVAD